MIEKLSLPFPFLSDPDRSQAIEPLGVADPKDPREIARPALVLFAPGGVEHWRFVSRDFADRLPEDEVLDQVKALDLPPTSQPPPDPGHPGPGPKAMPFEGLRFYFRGARFAALAMGLRHGHHDSSVEDDSKAYVTEMDRYIEAVESLESQRRGG